MKLSDIRPSVETSGELQEQFFSIQDQGMIFDILRNKMYSNPILAICREISCNARDAHREVGKSDVPIEISLPSSLDPFYKIKDFGPGISPDRMANVFIKYTASTKRNDNIQTGGFGLGAKTPFSYSDTFTIKTVYNGVEYNHACFIDETKVGKLATLDERPTSEPNGTEIIIPVKTNDFKLFTEWTESCTRYWDVKPLIKLGGKITPLVYKAHQNILHNKDWSITQSTDWQKSIKLVIDGIEYPLDLNALKTYSDTKLLTSSRGHIYLYFGVGELSLSASRESVYLDTATQNTIAKRLHKMKQDIINIVQERIEKFPNLWDANVYYRQELNKAFSSLDFLGTLTWHGLALSPSHIDMGCNVFNFDKVKVRSYHGLPDKERIRRRLATVLAFMENSTIVVNDLWIKEPTPKHIQKMFDSDPRLTSVQVICPSDETELQNLRTSINLDKLKPTYLSEIAKVSNRKYTPASARLLLFKYEIRHQAFRQVSYSSIEEDSKEKIICLLKKDVATSNRYVSFKDPKSTKNERKGISALAFESIAKKFSNCSFYGVDVSTPEERVKEEFEDFTTIESLLDDKIFSNKNINFVEIKYAGNNRYKSDDAFTKHQDKLVPLITNPGSIALERIRLFSHMRNIADYYSGLLQIYESIHGSIPDSDVKMYVSKNSKNNIDAMDKIFREKYPLLDHLNMYRIPDIATHLAHYINAVDNL